MTFHNVNLGTIRGGTMINLTADFCEAEVDIRLPPGASATAAHRARAPADHRSTASYSGNDL